MQPEQTSELTIRRGKYMCVELVMPGKTQPAITINYGLSNSPFTRDQAWMLAQYIRNSGNVINALEAVNEFFSSEVKGVEETELELDALLKLVDTALQTTELEQI